MNDYYKNLLAKAWLYGDTVNQFTPEHICREMVSLLDSTGFFDVPDVVDQSYVETHRVVDIYCKSGNFLIYLYHKFSKTLSSIIQMVDERDEFIWKFLLYCVCPNKRIIKVLKSRIAYETGYEGFDNIVYGDFVDDFEAVKGALCNMKFDVVVGNPPYNRDVYIDFMLKGCELSSSYTIMVTPAKLLRQTKGKDVESLVAVMDKVVFYQCESEIFNIMMPCGIAYYLLNNNKSDSDLMVKNVSHAFPLLNSEAVYNSFDYLTFSNSGIAIIKKLGVFNSLKLGYDLTKMYHVATLKQAYSAAGSRDSYRSLLAVQEPEHNIVFKPGNIIHNFDIVESKPSNKVLIFSSNDYDTCASFVSYSKTRLVRYLLLLAVCGYGNMFTDDVWRFVPTPDAFDHVFTDAELYAKYNLTDSEITIIESIIRGRC